jgi:hypothetical protein
MADNPMATRTEMIVSGLPETTNSAAADSKTRASP